MSTKPDKHLLRLAQEITDGRKIDWDREKESNRGRRDRLANLQTLERISEAFQSTQDDLLSEKSDSELDVNPIWEDTTKDPGESLPPPKTWGHLIIREKIGEGSFAEVYRARDPFLKIDVALKLFKPNKTDNGLFADRYLREARKLAKVSHDNVLVIHGADRRDGRVGLWTELIEGVTLEKLLKRDGPLGPDVAALFGIKICKAVAAVHRKRLVHRDIKTTNVMKEKRGRIILMDFNTAQEMKPREDFSPDSGSGTPLFMAPELFKGINAGIRSDIYSLGVLLYRLVTGRYPVEARKLSELRKKHEHRQKTSLLDARPDLDPSFTQIVEKALAPDPRDRYQSAGSMMHDLGHYLGIDPSSETKRSSLPGWLVRTAAVCVVALGLAGGTYWRYFGPFEAEASVYRIQSSGPEKIVPGSTVAPGDNLFLAFRGSRKLNVYVLLKDADGRFFLLFPNAETDKTNPLEGDLTHFLPGEKDGTAQYWPVIPPEGVESIQVVASLRPWNENIITTLPHSPSEAPDLPRRTRGLGDPTGGRPYPQAGVIDELLQKAQKQVGVDTWSIDFETTE